MRWSLVAFGVFWGMSIVCSPAGAADVLVIRSSDSPAILEAQRAIVERLAGRGVSARTVPVDELRTDTTAAERVWLAIGEDAASRVRSLRSPEISIAHCLVSDPAYAGFDPYEFPGVDSKAPLNDQLRLIQEILPEAKSLGVLVRSGSEAGRAIVQDLQDSLPSGWTVETVLVSATDSFADSIAGLLERQIDLVWTFPDEALYDAATLKSLLLACLRKGKPVYGFSQDVVQAGALFGIAMDSQAQGRAAAELVFWMLSHPGMGPGAIDLVDDAEIDGTIALNLSVAQVLGRSIPSALVQRAKYVVTP